jgi:hypothetical protein
LNFSRECCHELAKAIRFDRISSVICRIAALRRRRPSHGRESSFGAFPAGPETSTVFSFARSPSPSPTGWSPAVCTTSLFAALEVASGKVHRRCFKGHTHVEFIAFLESLAKRYPGRELHLICDNRHHKHPAVG